jgi:sulfite exporter TauE/SafE/copper chaperone CopZ
MLKNAKFFTSGLHCRSCKTLIETELKVLPGVKSIKVNHQSGLTEVEYDESKISLDEIKKAIKNLNYGIDDSKSISETSETETIGKPAGTTKKYFPLLAILPILVIGYYLINRLGLMKTMARLNDDSVSIFLIFIIGFLASFHCVGMCGGLIVGYSVNKQGLNDSYKSRSMSHIQYNLGRLISYTAVGAILGGFGSFFAINPTFTGLMLISAGIFMLLLGLSFLSKFQALEAIKLKTPDFIAKFLFNNKRNKKPKGPFVIGLLTAFMPCGPLQAMQLFALATGSILNGALAMAMYALGTIPVLFGFGHIVSMLNQTKIKQMMKVSGAIVIVLGIIMINRGLVNFNLGFNSFVPKSTQNQTDPSTDKTGKSQTINMDLTYNGYSPNVLYIKAGVPVKWVINVKQMSGCTDAIMIESLGIKKDLVMGENIIEFTPPKNVKEIKFSCWMRMVWGKFIVTDNDEASSAGIIEAASAQTQSPSGTCNGSGSCSGTCGAKTGGSSTCGATKDGSKTCGCGAK